MSHHDVMCRFRKRKPNAGADAGCPSKVCCRLNCRNILDNPEPATSGSTSGQVVANSAPHCRAEYRETGLSHKTNSSSIPNPPTLFVSECPSNSIVASLCRDLQTYQEPLSSSFIRFEDSVPMVALECELPLSGRLSPPTESSAPYLHMVNAYGHDGTVSTAEPPTPALCGLRAAKRKLSRLEVCIDDCADEKVREGSFNSDSEEELSDRREKRRRVESEAENSRDVSMIDNGPQLQECVVHQTVDKECHGGVELKQTECFEKAAPHLGDSLLLKSTVTDSIEEIKEPSPSSYTIFEEPTSTTSFMFEEVTTAASTSVYEESTPSLPAYDEPTSTSSFLFKTPRISPFHNTPKQRKEERRKILKLSIHKMRSVEDPEHFLRRSVLINNTMKRLQRELREEKLRSSPRRISSSSSCYGLYRRGHSQQYDMLSSSYLIHEEAFIVSDNDRITDDLTDALVTRLEGTSSSSPPSPVATQPPLQSPPLAQQTVLTVSPPSYDADTIFALPVAMSESSAGIGSTSCSSQSHREKHLFADMDTVFNNLIRALGES